MGKNLGFTIIELLVAIALLGILTGIGIMAVGPAILKKEVQNAPYKVSALISRSITMAQGSGQTVTVTLNQQSITSMRSDGAIVESLQLPKGAYTGSQVTFSFDKRGILDLPPGQQGLNLPIGGKTVLISRWGEVVVQ